MGCQPVTSGRPSEHPPLSRGDARCMASMGIDPRRRSIEGGEHGYGAVAALRGECGARSERGALGRRMFDTSAARFSVEDAGELAIVKEGMAGGLVYDSAPESEPVEEYTETVRGCSGKFHVLQRRKKTKRTRVIEIARCGLD